MATPVGTLKQFSGNTYRWDGTGWQYVEPSLSVGGSSDDPDGSAVTPVTTVPTGKYS